MSIPCDVSLPSGESVRVYFAAPKDDGKFVRMALDPAVDDRQTHYNAGSPPFPFRVVWCDESEIESSEWAYSCLSDPSARVGVFGSVTEAVLKAGYRVAAGSLVRVGHHEPGSLAAAVAWLRGAEPWSEIGIDAVAERARASLIAPPAGPAGPEENR